MLSDERLKLDRTFAALSDPTRREILQVLAAGETTAGDLAARFPISAPAVSRHLRVLESAGLINRRIDGQHRRCRLETRPLQFAVGWLEFYRKFWSESLQQLADHFDSESKPTTKRSTHGRSTGKQNGYK